MTEPIVYSGDETNFHFWRNGAIRGLTVRPVGPARPSAAAVAEYYLDEYEVTVTLTRRPSSIADGTLALYGELIYAKRNGRWYAAINPGHRLATARLDQFEATGETDAWIRQHAKILLPGEWGE